MDIDKLIKYATLDKVGAAKEAYRAIKAELLLNNSSKNPKPDGKIVNSITFCRKNEKSFDIEINELDLSIIRKLIKEKDEQISMYDANSRKDLADMYREQRDILKVFIPPEISKDRLEEAVTTAYPNGYTQKEMSRVIKEIKEFFPTADGKLISEVVKKHIVLNYIVIPIIVVIEVLGVSKLYPICKDSIWKLFILFLGVYFTYEIYRLIKNYYYSN